jgi:hypothetical protein
MTDLTCTYPGDRDQAIVSYLYEEQDEGDLVERAAFRAHLSTCGRCRAELSAFQAVRVSLGGWAPPEPTGLVLGRQPPAASRRPWWREAPAWAQAAAALLFLGVAAAIANLDVRYDANGLRVRTGWLAATAGPVAESGRSAPGGAGRPAGPGGDVPWRADIAALEQRLRADLGQPLADVANRASRVNAPNPELLRRVQALVDQSERRQERELALRLGEAIRGVNAQRQADLVRIDRNIGVMQNDTGREMLRQRSEMLNYVTVRTASPRPQ